MATKTAAKHAAASSKRAAKKSKPRARTASSSSAGTSPAFTMPGMGQMPKMPNMLTAEQAIDLYKANAAMALDIINAALAMMPDLKQMQNVVSAMQGVVQSGAPAFESMQRVMSDFSKMAQNAMPGTKR